MEALNHLKNTRPFGASPVHPALRSPLQCVKRFDGQKVAATAWDSLRRDEELWYDGGDCMVHFYSYGSSRRGPSLRVFLKDLGISKSPYLLNRCLFQCDSADSPSTDSGSDSGYSSSKNSEDVAEYSHLYVPAPSDLSRSDTHAYHIGTRNYFAFLLGKPLVGEQLSVALTGLWERIQLWQPHSASTDELLAYCEEQGYLNFSENPIYALAALQLAEEAGVPEIWMDAFTHSVGMHTRLDTCPERREISSTTFALITNASLEMNRHIAFTTQALGEFLEAALGPEFLGLSRPARDHLDRFRSFLHSFYVDKLGYYPPDENDCWKKQMWFGMCDDFRSLYEHLADMESFDDLKCNRSVSGGICVIQNIRAFNERYGLESLPHPLPLLPELPVRRRTVDSQIGLKNFKLGRTESTSDVQTDNRTPLERATNDGQPELSKNALVREFIRFERLKLVEKITISEARKVRWLLVYGMLQMLISITRAPEEVHDTASPSYPLCLPSNASPSWNKVQEQLKQRQIDMGTTAASSLRPSSEEIDRISIHPDCEANTAEEYFSNTSHSRSDSNASESLTPAPLRIAPQLSRTASIRSSVSSSVTSLQRSVIGSLSRVNSSRRSIVLPSLSRGNSLLMSRVETIGSQNELNNSDVRRRSRLAMNFVDDEQQPRPPTSASTALLYEANGEPILEDCQLDVLVLNPPASPAASYFSAYSRQDDDDSHSGRSGRSSVLDFCDSPVSEPSSVDNDSDYTPPTPPKSSDPSLAGFEFGFHYAEPSLPETLSCELRTKDSLLSIRSQPLNAGCYQPTGVAAVIPSRVSSLRANTSHSVAYSLLAVPKALRSESFSSIASSGSSIYPEDSRQAAEIEEEETRGRRRIRGLERLPAGFGQVDSRFFEGITELR